MEFEEILYEVEDHVLTITLNRPERLNAFTPTMGRELIEAFDAADADDDVRANLVPVARRRAAEKYQTDFPARATVLIGDTPSDVQAALDSGARIIAVASGKSTPDDLRRAGAAVVLPSLHDAHAVVRAVLNGDHQA